ncbi:MAG: MBL fold metallo-hydrolase [Tissierellia bacterium]|nr:MBL fold metallo-hydrolase [Tissierellia bacterium]
MKITVNTHSSIRIEWKERILYVDPYEIPEEVHDGHVILITHSHYDHYSPEDIEKVQTDESIFVLPSSMEGEAEELKGRKIIHLSPNEEAELLGFSVEAVAAYNLPPKEFHPKEAQWVGYILNLGGERVYITGDTDDNEDVRRVNADTVLLPIGGTYTTDPGEAAALINHLKPRRVIPTHYGNIVGEKGDGEVFKKLVDPSIEVEFAL